MINFTYTAFISTNFFFLLCILTMEFNTKHRKLCFSKKETLFILACYFCIIIRLIFPAELPITKSIYISPIYSNICRLLRKQLVWGISINKALVLIGFMGSITTAFLKLLLHLRFCRFIKQGKIIQYINVERKSNKNIMIPVIVIRHLDKSFITGIFNPKIVIAENAKEQYQYIIKHELEHFKHHDLWYKLILEILCVIYWWNPLIFYFRRCVHNMLELHNDLSVINKYSKTDRINYAEALVVSIPKENPRYLGLSLNCDNSFLKTRVYSVIYFKTKKKFQLGVILFFFIALSSFLIVFEPSAEPAYDYGTFDIQADDIKIIKGENKYFIFQKDECVGTLCELPDEFKKYTNFMEEKSEK